MWILIFLILQLAIFILISIFGKVHRPCKKYPNILFFLVAWCYSTLPESFSDVLVILALITILENTHRPCEQSFFLLTIPDFLIIFTVLTILGNVHRLCKEYTNIVDNGLHHVSLFFLIFFLTFWLYLP